MKHQGHTEWARQGLFMLQILVILSRKILQKYLSKFYCINSVCGPLRPFSNHVQLPSSHPSPFPFSKSYCIHGGNLGFLPFTSEHRKFWLENQMVCAIPFKKVQKIRAMFWGDAILLLFLVCSAGLDTLLTGSFARQFNIFSFMFLHMISTRVFLCKWWAPLVSRAFPAESVSCIKSFDHCNCDLFTHGTIGSSWELVETCPCVLDRIGIWKCWFLRREENRRRTRRKNLSEQRREPTTNSTHRWRPRWDLNPGQIGGSRVLSPLRHSCTVLQYHIEEVAT